MTHRRALVAASAAGAVLIGGGIALGLDTGGHTGAVAVATPRPALPAAATRADPLAADITAQQTRLRTTPTDYTAWGQLGLDYVQQAKVTVNPMYYPKAQGALDRSLALDTTVNYVGMAGMASLKSAEHDFAAARTWAERGLAIDPYNATLYGALDDADTQLGRYDEATAATQKMLNLHPGVPSFTRAEYVYELRGDLVNARSTMRRALADAQNPSDKAFANYYLGELAFSAGDPATALTYSEAGLAADPTDSTCLEGKARAEAALGRTAAAVADYTALVDEVPQPQYVVEFGDYLTSLGRTAAARQQYSLFETENRLFSSNGVTLDTDPTLYYADHGDAAKALAYGTVGIRIRPFVEMDDAYAWALHAAGRDAQALTWSDRALALGTRNALFYFHRGQIRRSLGDRAGATADLAEALAINPYFSPVQAPVARTALAALRAGR